MTNDQLDALIAQIRSLPAEKQEELAEVVEWLETDEEDFFEVPPEAWPGIHRGLAAVEAGDFATDEEMAELFAQARRGGGR